MLLWLAVALVFVVACADGCARVSGSLWEFSVSLSDAGEGFGPVSLRFAVVTAGADGAVSTRGATSGGSWLLSLVALGVLVVRCCCLCPASVRWPVLRLRNPPRMLLRRRLRRLLRRAAVRRTGSSDGL